MTEWTPWVPAVAAAVAALAALVGHKVQRQGAAQKWILEAMAELRQEMVSVRERTAADLARLRSDAAEADRRARLLYKHVTVLERHIEERRDPPAPELPEELHAYHL